MGNIAGLIQGAVDPVSAQGLQNQGYQQFTAQAAPALNQGAYGPDQTTQANAANINMGQANTELGNQQSLISQLQAQAQGSGPNLAGLQLQQATQQNLAGQLAMAASQRGNQNPGAAQSNLANEGAAANQAAAGQAAQLRAQQQLASQGALSGALGQVSSQQQGLAENQANLQQQANLQNAQAANQMAEFNTGSAQAGNAAQQAQYQFGTNIAAQQQSQENAAIAGQSTQAQAIAGNAAVGGIGGGLNAAGAAVGSYGGGGSNAQVPSYQSNNGQGGQYGTAQDMGDQSGPDNTGSDEARGGINAGSRHLVGEAGPEAVVSVPNSLQPHAQTAPEIHMHIHPGQVVTHPEMGHVGDSAHAVAVVPLTPGAPMDEHVKELLAHPDFQKAVSQVVSHHADALKAAFESRRK